MILLVLFLTNLFVVASGREPSRVEIAPSVWMPRLTINAYPNTAGWLKAGGRAVDSALDCGGNRPPRDKGFDRK